MKHSILAVAAFVAAYCTPLPAGAITRAQDHASDGVSHPPGTAADTTLYYRDLLSAVRRHNPTVRAARLGAAAMATEERRATALPDPGVMVTYQPFPILTARGSQRTQIRVEQGLPFPGKRKLRGSVARTAAAVAESDVDVLEQDLLLQARTAWLDLRQAAELQEYIDRFAARLRDYEAVAAEQYAVGSGPQQPILKAQLERTSLARMRLELDSREVTAREALRRILGLAVTPGRNDGDDIDVLIPDAQPETLVELARRSRPEFESIRLLARNAEAEIALARRESLPDFGVNVTWFDIASEPVPPTANGRDALAIGVSVKVPLWRDSKAAGVEKQQLKLEQVSARNEALSLELETRIADLLDRVHSDGAQLKLYEQALLPQSQSTIDATISAYSTGQVDFLTLLDAERMRYSTQVGYTEVQTRYRKAIIQLERVLGVTTLTELSTLIPD